MPIEKPKGQKASKKVKAVSSKDLNPDGTIKVVSNAERKAAFEKARVLQLQQDKAAREAATAERLRVAREAELAATKKKLEAESRREKTVAQLTEDDGPQTIATCVAKVMGLDGKLKPKQVLDKVAELMPELKLADGLPKAQLLQVAGVLAEKAAQIAAAKAEKAAAKAAAKAAKDAEAAAEKAAKEEAERAQKEAIAA